MKTEKQIKNRLNQVNRLLAGFTEAKQKIALNPRLQAIENDLKVKKKLLEWILN